MGQWEVAKGVRLACPRTLSFFPLPSLLTTQRGLQLRRREGWRLTGYNVGAEGNRGIARIFQREKGAVTPRILTRLACWHLCCVLKKVVREQRACVCVWWGGGGEGTSLQEKKGPLQMFGPANGVCIYLAQEKIYCMFLLRIRVFSPTELKGHKSHYLTAGGVMAWAPRIPLAMPLGMEESC